MIECRHCRHAEWVGQWGELVCTYPKRSGEVCPPGRHACSYYLREPGADDDREWP